MRLLVASDLHGSMESLSFLLHRAHQFAPDALVLLGDLVYHGPLNAANHARPHGPALPGYSRARQL